MSAAMRGLLILGGVILFTALVCVGPAFFWMPSAGAGVGLPVITMPAEVLSPTFPVFGTLTNTLTTTFLVDLFVILIAVVVGRALRSAPPDRFVPRGFTNFIELIGEFLYNQTRGLLAEKTRWVFPVAASVFIFLLVANWVKLLPGFETVGLVVCAEYNINAPDSDPLAPGFKGYRVAGLSEQAPDARPIMSLYNDGRKAPEAGQPVDTTSYLGERTGDQATRADTLKCEEQYPWAKPPLAQLQEDRFVALMTEKLPADSFTDEERKKALYAEVIHKYEEHGKHLDAEFEEELRHLYHEDLVKKAGGKEAVEAASADKLTLAPFFRGLTTDLNVPLALALVVFVLVEFWGVRAQRMNYLYKFINLPALAETGKNPMKAIDFLVGLIEIVSELSRLVSLTFRLFGAMFAGGILLVVFTFLVAFIAPLPIYILELVIGGMQAYVFAVLTIIYASQAVISHHAEEHGDHDHGHQAHGAEAVQH